MGEGRRDRRIQDPFTSLEAGFIRATFRNYLEIRWRTVQFPCGSLAVKVCDASSSLRRYCSRSEKTNRMPAERRKSSRGFRFSSPRTIPTTGIPARRQSSAVATRWFDQAPPNVSRAFFLNGERPSGFRGVCKLCFRPTRGPTDRRAEQIARFPCSEAIQSG